MRLVVCDVCETKSDGEPDWIRASIPSLMLGELGERLEVDICSLACLAAIGGSRPDSDDFHAEPEPDPTHDEVEPDRQISIPQGRGHLEKAPGRYLTPEESEDYTGVRMKY